MREGDPRMAGVDKSTGKASSDPGWVFPRWWEETAETIAYDSSSWSPPITLVCGPGNSGKSTFSRLLLNTLLPRYRRVGYLDTDVGQPEFTTPGCVSLHIIDKQTPDLTILYLKTPLRCLFFGDVCSGKDPKVYLNSIFSLYDHFHSEYYQSTELDYPTKPMLPLVINTSGWVKGIGYDMLVKMMRYMYPSHVVQMRISAESKNLPTGTFWLDGNQKHPVKLFEICASPNESLNRQVLIKKDARMIRDLRLIAYFRQCLPRDLDISSHQELVHSLASIPPCEVPLPRIKVQHLHCQMSSIGDNIKSTMESPNTNPIPAPSDVGHSTKPPKSGGKKKSSWIWEHLTKIDCENPSVQRVTCNYRSKDLACPPANGFKQQSISWFGCYSCRPCN